MKKVFYFNEMSKFLYCWLMHEEEYEILYEQARRADRNWHPLKKTLRPWPTLERNKKQKWNKYETGIKILLSLWSRHVTVISRYG